jgi:putative phosphoesterase
LDAPVLTVGVIADTHVPDRARTLHPRILPLLRERRVDLILHAGDISTPEVLEQLEEVAPVKAVRGNRDWYFLKNLPMVQELNLAGVPVLLTHGHMGFASYLKDKYLFIRDGYNFERYHKKLVKLVPNARVIVFGHTHWIENVLIDGRLWFNPGSATIGMTLEASPSIGVLRIYDTGEVRGEVLTLDGYRLLKGAWKTAGSS